MNLVVDASIAVKWLFEEPDSDRAEALLEAGERKRVKLVAPDILTAEVANALWKRMRRGDLDRRATLEAVNYFESICPLLHPIEGLWRPALNLAIGYNHPVYDCLYLALAEALPGDLVTADERFYKAFNRDFPPLQLLRSWSWEEP